MRKPFGIALVSLLLFTSVAGIAGAAWPSTGPASPAALSGPFGLWQPGQFVDILSERLELTPEQLDELRALVVQEAPALRRQISDLVDARRGLFGAIHEHPPSNDSIQSALDDVAAAERRLAFGRADLVHQAHQVLTPTQQQEMDSIVGDVQTTVERVIGLIRDIVVLRLGV